MIPPSFNIEKRFKSWEFSKKIISTEFQWNVNNEINNFGVSGLRVTSHWWIRVNGERLPSLNAYPQCGILQWGEISKYSSQGGQMSNLLSTIEIRILQLTIKCSSESQMKHGKVTIFFKKLCRVAETRVKKHNFLTNLLTIIHSCKYAW